MDINSPAAVNLSGVLQTVKSADLAAALRGDVDLRALLALELASRGQDQTTGAWIGFPKAAAQFTDAGFGNGQTVAQAWASEARQ